jgi:hypothetical protein
MKSKYKIKTLQMVLSMLLLCVLLPQTGWSMEIEQISLGPISSAFAIMAKGQTKTYTVTSDFFPDAMIIGIVVYGGGNMLVSVSKTDTSGELLGVMQIGAYTSVPDEESQKYGYMVGITPCSPSVVGRFFDYGYGLIISGLLASLEEGPHTYTLTIQIL